MSKTLEQWLSEGQELYTAALAEFRSVEAELERLESVLIEKQQQVNQIAQVLGRPAIEGSRRAMAQVINIPAAVQDDYPVPTPATHASIARALNGQLRR